MAAWRSLSLCQKADQQSDQSLTALWDAQRGVGQAEGQCPSSAGGWAEMSFVVLPAARWLRRQWWRRFLAACPDGLFPPASCPAARTPAAPPHLPQTQAPSVNTVGPPSRFQGWLMTQYFSFRSQQRRVRYGTNQWKSYQHAGLKPQELYRTERGHRFTPSGWETLPCWSNPMCIISS